MPPPSPPRLPSPQGWVGHFCSRHSNCHSVVQRERGGDPTRWQQLRHLHQEGTCKSAGVRHSWGGVAAYLLQSIQCHVHHGCFLCLDCFSSPFSDLSFKKKRFSSPRQVRSSCWMRRSSAKCAKTFSSPSSSPPKRFPSLASLVFEQGLRGRFPKRLKALQTGIKLGSFVFLSFSNPKIWIVVHLWAPRLAQN